MGSARDEAVRRLAEGLADANSLPENAQDVVNVFMRQADLALDRLEFGDLLERLLVEEGRAQVGGHAVTSFPASGPCNLWPGAVSGCDRTHVSTPPAWATLYRLPALEDEQ